MLVALAFVVALRAVLSLAWPAMPLPQIRGLAFLAVLGAMLGLLVPRMLPLFGVSLLLAGGMASGSLVAGSVMGFVIGAPFAGLGVVGGLLARAAIRRRGRPVRRPVRPRPAAPAALP